MKFFISVLLQISVYSLALNLDLIDETSDGGWSDHSYTRSLYVEEGPCTIVKKNYNDLSQDEFIKSYVSGIGQPVVIQSGSFNKKFQEMCKKCNLIEKYGDKMIILSTANSYSYDKAKIKFSEYAEKYVKQQDSTIEGSSTFYWFGDNNHTEWADLFDLYNQPPYKIPRLMGALSFGVAGALTGVPFHIHGPTFAETIYGRKRWFLYPPSATPQFNPDTTTLLWMLESYPNLTETEKPLECTLRPGEILFIPDRWWHATLNLDNAVFISTFMG